MSAEEHVVLKEPNGISWRRCKQLQLAPATILSAFQALPDMNPLEPVAQPAAEAAHAQASSNPLLKPKVPTKALKPPVKETPPTILRNIVPTPDYRPRSRTLSSSLQTYMQSAEAPPILNVYAMKQAEIESKSPYLTDVTYYTPQSRRSFYHFIKESYTESFKAPLKIKGPPDPDACKKTKGKDVEAFLYQKFVREYIRNAGPYRGILVYHGLGSGKTCSSIAAAEALYGTSNKKIIVMTPSSLRPNFINEVSFCGFRHFNVNNCWEAIEIPSEPGPRYVPLKSSMEYLYATEVLSMSEEFVKKYSTIWIPNFEKTDETDATHYKQRTQQERDAILRQVTHIIENRITFISYNGISAAKLKSFAAPDPATGKRMFDDAVVVIDEVHNLTRLMQGNITPYIVERKKKKKGEEVTEDLSEPIVPGRWVPKLLNRHESYKRAYLFYKLLTDARNSKIIGLSGTPIINFPEELGIMANLLAGYTECAEFTIYTVKDEVIHQLKTLIEKEPRVDIIRFAKQNQTTNVLISVFQEGYQRSAEYSGNGVGVEYNEDAQEDIMVIYPRIKTVIQPVLQKLGIRMEEPLSEIAQAGSSKPSRNGPYVSYPRLPIDDDTFRKEFINLNALGAEKDKKNDVIANRTVLQKRLTGLISYYKGSKEDYMPRVTDHGVVPCAMSDYVLSKYTEERGREIDIEKKQKTKASPTLFEAVDMFSKMKNPSNYRFRSRSLCNFAFPKTITRPFPGTQEELESETTEPVVEAVYSEEAGELPAEEATSEERAVIEEEEKQADAVLGEDEKKTEGGGEDCQDNDDEDCQEDFQEGEYQDSMVGGMDPPVLAKRKPRMGTLPAAPPVVPAAPSAPPVVPAAPAREPPSSAEFQRKIKAAMQALEDAKNEYLNLDDVVPERSLHYYSTKMDRMLRNMNHSKGSNLVYSQFKTVEGIGAFGVALKANGYVEIVIEGSDAAPRFSQQTADSLRKGPAAKERRFITFTGEGSKERRTLILNVFNGNFDKLPSDMRDIMLSSGYGENKNQKGEVCWVIGITGAGAEGISLKCCRSVHIMEPFWNNVRLEQVKGRAIRICSHMDLPVEDRHVDIYTYVTTFSMEQLRKKEGGVDTTIRTRDADPTSNGTRVLTSDENVLRVSTKKEEINHAILTVMKETAVDCGLNVADNQVECVEFHGKPDQYMFDPDLTVDKTVSSTDFKQQERAFDVEEEKESNVEDVTLIGYKGKRYLMHSKGGKKKASAVMYMFAETDTQYQKPLGEADIHPVSGKYYNYHLYE